MRDLISVIINVYNGEEYIEKCVLSVVGQTYHNLEIIIVNDGSTDNTLKICKKIKDSRIQIITTKNQGLSLSRNVGLDHATGKYLFFVDADDYIEKDTIEYLYGLLKKNHVKMATCNYLYIYNYDFSYTNKKEEIVLKDSLQMIREILLYTLVEVVLFGIN